MASVLACVLGGDPVRLEAADVGDVKEQLNVATYTATVDGEPTDDSFELTDEQFVSLSPSVKGGR